MSYNVTATQAKLFGFSPKYIWDDLVESHTKVARKIKGATFNYFMEIEDVEDKISAESRKILKAANIDNELFTMEMKAKRETMVSLKRRKLGEMSSIAPLSSSLGKRARMEMEFEESEMLEGGGCGSCADLRLELESSREEVEKWKKRYFDIKKLMNKSDSSSEAETSSSDTSEDEKN